MVLHATFVHPFAKIVFPIIETLKFAFGAFGFHERKMASQRTCMM